MQCPLCGSDATKVIDSRPDPAGRLRKRRCTECGHGFGTLEHIAASALKIRKRDGRLEDFSRAKLIRGITRAAHLHALPPADIDAFADRVTGLLQPAAPGIPVTSTEIGRLVLQALDDSRTITDIARIRYALVFLGQHNGPAGLCTREFLHWLHTAYGRTDLHPPPRTPWRVIKRNGHIQAYDPAKLQHSLTTALKGRGTPDTVRQHAGRIAHDTTRELTGQALVTSQQIAAEVIKHLLHHDTIAYLRYSSLIKRYKSPDDFWIDAHTPQAMPRT
jgi:transcriptional repressor NrdR